MSDYKDGQKVKYIGNTYSALTKGKEYTVGGKYHGSYPNSVGIVEDDEGRPNGHALNFFELAKPSVRGPITTETVTRIEPGVYGRVHVMAATTGDNLVQLQISPASPQNPHLWLSASELREAIETLITLAEHLEGQKP